MPTPETMGIIELLSGTQGGVLKGLSEGRSDINALLKLLPKEESPIAKERLQLAKQEFGFKTEREQRLKEGMAERKKTLAENRLDKELQDAARLVSTANSALKATPTSQFNKALQSNFDKAVENLYVVYNKKYPGQFPTVADFKIEVRKEPTTFLGFVTGETEETDKTLFERPVGQRGKKTAGTTDAQAAW